MGKKNTDEMSFLDHIEDLRWHLIRITLSILICATVAFIFSGFIFEHIIFAPKRMDFPTYELLCQASQFIGINDTTFCATEFPFKV